MHGGKPSKAQSARHGSERASITRSRERADALTQTPGYGLQRDGEPAKALVDRGDQFGNPSTRGITTSPSAGAHWQRALACCVRANEKVTVRQTVLTR